MVANCNVDLSKKSFGRVAISGLGTKTCLLCPLGQLQSLNCDKIPQLHSTYKKANMRLQAANQYQTTFPTWMELGNQYKQPVLWHLVGPKEKH